MDKRTMLCISTIDWNFLWQRHQTFIQEFSNDGWEIDYIENSYFRNPRWKDLFRLVNKLKKNSMVQSEGENELPNGVTIIPPKVLPPNGLLFRLINRRICVPRLLKKLNRHYDMIIIYMPSYTTKILMESITSDWIIFDCVANFEGHPNKPKDYQKIESEILCRANMVLTDSSFLYKKLEKKHPKVYQLHHGVQIKKFHSNYDSPLKSYRRICFFGGIDERIDWDAIKVLSDSGYLVTLIGPCKVKIPINVEIKPAMNMKSLSKEILKYDAFIIPYKISEYTEGIIPAKIYECLATGKPVLTASLPSVYAIKDLLYICQNSSEYVDYMRNLQVTESSAIIRKRKEYALTQSSDHNFKVLKRQIEMERGTYEEKTVTCN